jgi:hypothetical protein
MRDFRRRKNINKRLSAKNRRKRGIWREGEDAMIEIMIDPDFYSILKEERIADSAQA